ncbi:MAG: NAD-dependent epimerase/dehydratase family protein [Spartobacteria bacterium]|nr:NAD-dependent epimerase/dehydratase family protein [Spartobacteria bacterium]
MLFKHILITGGAGFIGSHIAMRAREVWKNCEVTAFDNLSRRGSELNVPRLNAADVRFVKGDIRTVSHLDKVGHFDVLIDCAAEPSVHAGASGSPREVIDINLTGSINTFEKAREHGATVLFLSTSRVYPIPALNGVAFEEQETRFALSKRQDMPGVSGQGIAEEFTLTGPRSFYGATKLAAELLLQEYAFNYGLPVLINRCGLVAGPWQMGRVDQGIIAYWLAGYLYDKPLCYTGFDGLGKQIRDVLHVEDLCDLVVLQLQDSERWKGDIYNVGGGLENAVSIRELNRMCSEISGRQPGISEKPDTSPLDVRMYVSDNTRVSARYGWAPSTDVKTTVSSLYTWFDTHKDTLAPIFG